ncbi:DNA-binding SARP family transcriptional activator [Tamaricihabitans halophyticus]|uniref:DNA-binding SARP family transcriptional activator n=1 Tax=Tamaricihabitans halophyticus TaxID=1262583 RepID=A0A4R2RD31_9PSEU|nr:DNA-binding SARP family transcriptional activator [Tamaricihabitans halophyticus]
MEFEVLGTMRIRNGSSHATVDGRIQRTLLGLLLARANTPVPVDVLVEAIWGESSGARASQRLQVHVHRLRKALGSASRIDHEPQGYQLRLWPGELDAERFETLLDEAAELAGQAPEECARLSRKALELWHGRPYEGLDIPLLADEAERLTNRRLTACEDLYRVELSRGRHTAIIGELIELAKENPLREQLHAQLMTALYGSGRQAEALRVYRDVRRHLIDELGLEPGPELRAIEQQVLTGEPIELAEPEPRPVRPAQLPHNVRSFIGRDTALVELDELVETDGAGIAVLTGTAGVGKTALAVHWAHRVRERFPDGQLYVDLRGYGPEQPVPPTEVLAGFLRGLGVDTGSIPQDAAELAGRLRTALAGRRILLVLDNARTVEQVRPLLPGVAACVVLVTSRDAMTGLVARDGARRIELARLSTVESERLVRRLAEDRLTEDSSILGVVVQRCARLPLALRIAAELINIQPANQLAELVAELADEQTSLDMLDVDGDPQTAVRAVFSWSYHQLAPAAARIFRLCGLHPGQDFDVFDLAALAGSTVRATRQALRSLQAANLLDRTAQGRYQPHDLLRAYAAELVAETDSAEERTAAITRLLEYYLHSLAAARLAFNPHSLAVPCTPATTRLELPTIADRTGALNWYAAERDSLVAAVRAAVQHGQHAPAWQLCTMLVGFFYLDNYWDGWVSTHRAALELAERADDRAGQAYLLGGLGNAYDELREYEESVACHERAAELFDEIGHEHGAAWNANNLGVVYDTLGRYAEAIRCYRRALGLFQEANDPSGASISLNNLGDVYRILRSFDESAKHLRQALELQRAEGTGDAQRFTCRTLGDLHLDSGRPTQAINWYQRALEISLELGERFRSASMLARLGDAHAAVGDNATARDYWWQALNGFGDLDGARTAELREKLDT